MSKIASALALAGRGFRVFPLKPLSSVPLDGFPWKENATTDAATIERWWRAQPDANIAVACGEVTVVDLDVKGGKAGIDEARLLELPFDTLTVRTPSGGLHLYFSDSGLRNRVRMSGTSGVDVRGDGGYVVAPGSEREDGRYEIVCDLPLARLPGAVVGMIGAAPARARAAQRAGGSDSEIAVASAQNYLTHVAPLAVEGAGGDDTTFRVCASLRDYGVSQDTALALLLEHWNDRCSPPWDADELQTKIRNAYEYAQNDTPQRDFSAAVEGLEGLAPPPPVERAPAASGAFELQTIADARNRPPVPWLVHQILPLVGVACIYGESSSGKSLVLADLLMALARSSLWCGGSVRHGGGSFVFAAEAAEIVGPRLLHAGATDDLPLVWADCPAFMADENRWELLAAGINQAREFLHDRFNAPLRVVAIDTYAAAGVVEDENDNAATQRALSTLSQYAKKAQVLILLIHHPAKGSKELRGAGALRGALDAAIKVERTTGNLREVSLEKCRNARPRQLGAFTIDSSQFVDSDGVLDSVPLLRWADEPDLPVIAPARATEFLNALETLGGRARIEELREQFKAFTGLGATVSTAFQSCVEHALRVGQIRQNGWFFERVQP